MEIKRHKHFREDIYNYDLIKDDKTLSILFGGNFDLYFLLKDNNKKIGLESTEINFEITKENGEIFDLFDSLYNDVMSGKILEDDKLDDPCNIRSILIDDNNNINWLSDDAPDEIANKFKMSKLDDDTYNLIFVSNDNMSVMNNSISIRFSNSGSSYEPYNIIFMRLYNKLQKIDPCYHQITIDEYQYTKRKSI